MFDHLGFKFDTNNKRISHYDLITPRKCSIFPKESRLEFETYIYNLSSRFEIMRAEPFKLLRENDNDEICLLKYSGPKFAVYR